MATASSAKPSHVKVRKHREGLRPIQILVPNVREVSFLSLAHRQSLAVAASRHSQDDQAFIDAVSALDADEGDNA